MVTICTNTGVGIVPILSCMNEITRGLFGLSLLVGVWLLVYFGNSNSQARDRVVGASWITFLVAVLLRVAGGVDDVYLGMAFVLAIGSLAMLAIRRTA